MPVEPMARMGRIACAGLVGALALPAAAAARPADVNIVNASPIDVAVPGGVKIDPAQNTVQIGGQPIQVQQAPFHVYAFVPAPASAGGKSCTPLTVDAGKHARVDSVSVTTFNDSGAVAYVRFLAKEASSSSRILVQRVSTIAVGSDPATNSRSGVLAWGAHISGGNVFDVQLGEFHSLSACIQSSSGASAAGAFSIDGIVE